MSAYGPALFLARLGGEPISETEQDELLALVSDVADELELRDDEGEPVEPSHYDYDGCEDEALGILIYSTYAYASSMPAEVREAIEASWVAMGSRLGRDVEKRRPGKYRFVAYGVEE